MTPVAALQVHWPGSGQPDGPPDCACAYPNGTTVVSVVIGMTIIKNAVAIVVTNHQMQSSDTATTIFGVLSE